MTLLQLLLIFLGPFLAVAPFVAVAVRECPELWSGRRPVPASSRARYVRPVPAWGWAA